MEKFEYYTYAYDTEGFWGGKVNLAHFQSELNRLGQEGWELVSCTSTNQSYGSSKSVICIFKRKIA